MFLKPFMSSIIEEKDLKLNSSNYYILFFSVKDREINYQKFVVNRNTDSTFEKRFNDIPFLTTVCC